MGGDEKKGAVCLRETSRKTAAKQQKKPCVSGLVCVGNQKKLQSYKRLRGKH